LARHEAQHCLPILHLRRICEPPPRFWWPATISAPSTTCGRTLSTRRGAQAQSTAARADAEREREALRAQAARLAEEGVAATRASLEARARGARRRQSGTLAAELAPG
jgi:hypothetical protein